MNQIDPELLKRLDALAAKLGVTAQYLWSVLMHQAYAEAMADIATSAVFFALIAAGIYSCLQIFKTRKRVVKERLHYGSTDLTEKEESWSHWDNYGDAAATLTVLMCVSLAVLLIVAVSLINEAALDLINPAYFAFKHIGDIVR